MDDLFFYGLSRVYDLIEDMDKTAKEKTRENLRAMCVAYEKQRNATQQARSFERNISQRYEALKKQLKSSETTNDQRLSL